MRLGEVLHVLESICISKLQKYMAVVYLFVVDETKHTHEICVSRRGRCEWCTLRPPSKANSYKNQLMGMWFHDRHLIQSHSLRPVTVREITVEEESKV